MLVLDPKERISIPEILSHKWMSDGSYSDDMLMIMEEMGKNTLQNGHWNGIIGSGKENDVANVNIENLFKSKYTTKLSYQDYCSIT